MLFVTLLPLLHQISRHQVVAFSSFRALRPRLTLSGTVTGIATNRKGSSIITTTRSVIMMMTTSTGEDPPKRAKMDDDDTAVVVMSDRVIGTHSGTFQADEAMGCYILRQTSEYRNSTIVRSRDPSVLDALDIVIDVGGVYDHSKKRYDHHQRDYDERFDEGRKDGTTTDGRCTKLSASGLVYRHYGKDAIKSFYPHLSSVDLELAYVRLYDSLLEALDAVDTGVEMVPEGVTPLYRDTTTCLPSRVGRLNPRWNEVSSEGVLPVDPDVRFEEATRICGVDFISVLTKIVESDLPARQVVEGAVLNRNEVDESGEVICLPSGGVPWKGHLYDLEREYTVDPPVKFVLYVDQGGMWRVQAVTVEGRAFENRLSLPQEWRGVRDEDLVAVTGIKGSRFVHAGGFIGGNDTYEGALEMAQAALRKK